MYWSLLFSAIAAEIVGTACMKASDGFSRIVPGGVAIACYIASTVLFILALKRIELSVAYVIWSGVGMVATVVIGILWFQEAMTAVKAGLIATIVFATIALVAVSPPADGPASGDAQARVSTDAPAGQEPI